MDVTMLFCALAFIAVTGGEVTPENLLDEISSAVINDMVKSLDSMDVMTIDAALRDATAKVQPKLKELAEMMDLTTQKAARLVAKQVSKQVSQDNRLLEALGRRQGGKIATRSAVAVTHYLSNLVYKALMTS